MNSWHPCLLKKSFCGRVDNNFVLSEHFEHEICKKNEKTFWREKSISPTIQSCYLIVLIVFKTDLWQSCPRKKNILRTYRALNEHDRLIKMLSNGFGSIKSSSVWLFMSVFIINWNTGTCTGSYLFLMKKNKEILKSRDLNATSSRILSIDTFQLSFVQIVQPFWIGDARVSTGLIALSKAW